MTVNDLLEKMDQATAGLRELQEEGGEASAESLLEECLDRLRGFHWLRRLMSAALVIGLLAAMGYFLWGLLPRDYSLTISGGDILSTRHQLAMTLRNEGAGSGLHLAVRPIAGTLAILDAVNERAVDVAFIQGGLDAPLPNVRHVAAIVPEVLHLLVRGDIQALADLKGRTINLGSPKSGTRIIGEQVLAFSELRLGVDYAPSAYNAEELLALPEAKLPDAVLNIATVPSFLAEELIKHKGYRLLEIPFPKALALRHGWVADTTILPYAYKTAPPVPDKEIQSLGVNLFLVGHKDVPEQAVLRLLDVLYSTGVRNAVRMHIDPNAIARASGYPLSVGTERFLQRNEPLFSEENLDRLKSMFGLLMSGATFIVMGLRWLRGRGESRVRVDREFRGYIRLAAHINAGLAQVSDDPGIGPEEITQLTRSLSGLRAALLIRLAQVQTVNPGLTAALFNGLEMAASVLARLEPGGAAAKT